MKIETIEHAGYIPAFIAMRNPMDSWEKSDSEPIGGNSNRLIIGDVDKALSEKLQKAGTEHSKHLRMIMVWANITAPRYWWNEFDTYRIGVEKESCSTMHKLMARPVTMDDFENDGMNEKFLREVIESINGSMTVWAFTNDPDRKKEIWRGIIQALPQSYLQRRTVMMSYAALRNIYRQREGHKLKEWQQFREWIEGLPESWMITDYEVYDCGGARVRVEVDDKEMIQTLKGMYPDADNQPCPPMPKAKGGNI